MLLFDAKPPDGAARPGGHGARLRLAVAPWADIRAALAAGRRAEPGNVARAIAASDAPGVDVSSGVETAPGVKERRR